MNDRYLYRAKRTDNGEWVEGHLITDEHDEKKCFIGYVFGTNDDGTPHDYDVVEVYQSTICQCTGLKDKNGNLIWENDVVTGWFDGKRITGYIMYGSNATFFIERKGLYGIHLDNSEDWLEVIGNIFDEGSENIGKGAEEN